ncbi:TrkH family potassium uptake protein [uncultured Microscilla sp.]|uniref:TrkH family potassium uptake protein n=1 Tax=uncultured Microscilla sp. TaxID=432653 RepID=UPI00261712D7|nr:potassium transporter TrkG [uncultured Microscilla sp.]
MNQRARFIEQLNHLLYSNQERIAHILRIINNVNTSAIIVLLLYCYGADLEADDISSVFNWLELNIFVYALHFLVRWLYALNRRVFITENLFETILVGVFLFVGLTNALGLYLFYNIFLLLEFADYRVFYESIIATYLVALLSYSVVRSSQAVSDLKINPATTFIASFILLILIGTGLLMMPAMSTAPGGVNFLDALFTSTSASCVTGLSVISAASDFSVKGQIVILFLIQLGGIGIVSFATFFATFLSQGVGIKQQAIIQDVLSSESLSSARNLLKQVIVLTFIIEVLGSIAVFMTWNKDVVFYTPEYKTEITLNKPFIDTTNTVQPNTVDTVKIDTAEINIDEGLPTFGEEKEVAQVSTDSTKKDETNTGTVASTDPSNTGVPANLRINNSLGNKIYFSVFHSISAFCNAGFSLFPDGLYQKGVRSSYILHLVFVLIITFGSLGFSAIQDIFSPKNMRERLAMPWKQWSLGTRIAVNMTLFLTILGAVGFYFLEQGKPALQDKNLLESIITSLFQSATTRTAGFNTVELGLSTPSLPSYIMIIFLMFIGAAPGSTGGGIKTTTFLLLIMSAIANIQGKKTVDLGRRQIAQDVISRAFSIVAFAITYNFVCMFILAITQPNAPLLQLFFEQISAFATVGLSTGITGNLTEGSKIVIITSMYIGRVGTLTLALALSKKVISTSYKYPTAHVMVG